MTWALFSMILVLDLLHRNFLGLGMFWARCQICLGIDKARGHVKTCDLGKTASLFLKRCELVEMIWEPFIIQLKSVSPSESTAGCLYRWDMLMSIVLSN